jgi:hypothetical protein
MNEPQLSNSTWQTAAQQAVTAIRSVDMHSTVYVEGTSWSGAETWPLSWYNGNLNITDTANKIVYEAHQYFDNNGGTYTQPFNAQTDYTNLGSDLIQPFLNWLNANGHQGMIGEFGVPVNDPQWLPLLRCGRHQRGVRTADGHHRYGAPAAPVIASDTITSTNQVVLNGTAEANSTIQVYEETTLLGRTTANTSGAWSFTTLVLDSGSHTFSATATDAAGNTSVASQLVDPTIPPDTPTISSFSPDSNFVGDGITNASQLVLKGVADANTNPLRC